MRHGLDKFAEYRVQPSRCGQPSAIHVPSGILLHSAIDPVAEAREMVADYSLIGSDVTVLFGGGLGYLPEAFAQYCGNTHTVYVIEPDVDLLSLARACRPEADYFSSRRIRLIPTSTPSLLSERTSALPSHANVIVSPYFERIRARERAPFAEYVQALRTERASRQAYDSLLAEHKRINHARIAELPRALGVRLAANKLAIVVGAGPSLDECLSILKRHRETLIVIAASGAVPSLQTAGIESDWIVALEAKNTIVADLAEAASRSGVIVFESTNPQILETMRSVLFNGDGIQTSGGTTMIPALDFALRCSNADVAIVGVDLGQSNRAYAAEAKRNPLTNDSLNGASPKYTAMRYALEKLIAQKHSGNRVLYHVLPNARTLRGTTRLSPQDLERLLLQHAGNQVTV